MLGAVSQGWRPGLSHLAPLGLSERRPPCGRDVRGPGPADGLFDSRLRMNGGFEPPRLGRRPRPLKMVEWCNEPDGFIGSLGPADGPLAYHARNGSPKWQRHPAAWPRVRGQSVVRTNGSLHGDTTR